MKLLIDAGNTRTKWAWCPEQPASMEAHMQAVTLENHQWMQDRQGADAQALLDAIAQAEEVWLSNVAGEPWQQALAPFIAKVRLVKAVASALGVNNGYSLPAQLGSDRWCSLLAVWQLHAKDALVVTAGTAMTMDALCMDSDAEKSVASFVGGSIQPGLRLMWQSLQHGTAQLDFAYPMHTGLFNGFARHSQQAMWVGCIQAMLSPMTAQFERLQLLTPGRQPSLILSGGDAEVLQRYLPDALAVHAIIVDNLVLKGLACLAESKQQ